METKSPQDKKTSESLLQRKLAEDLKDAMRKQNVPRRSVIRLVLAAVKNAEIAKQAMQVGIKAVTFDRNRFKYHGRVKALAMAAREAGLVF